MNTDIQTITESGLLEKSELASLEKRTQSIIDGFNRRQRFRPRFLMETAVLNDMNFPTPDGKYWQCNVERDTQFRNLVTLSFDFREKLADIMILEEEMEEEMSVGHRTKKKVQIERENALLIYMRKEAQERVREIDNWSEIMLGLEPQLKHDPQDVEAHMPESYALQYARKSEAMQLAQGQSDMSGAMNIISLARSIHQHRDVQKLIADEQKEQLPKGDD